MSSLVFLGNTDITNSSFYITAKDILFFNTDDNIEAYDIGDIYLTGDSSFITDGGIIENRHFFALLKTVSP